MDHYKILEEIYDLIKDMTDADEIVEVLRLFFVENYGLYSIYDFVKDVTGEDLYDNTEIVGRIRSKHAHNHGLE